MVRIAAGYDRHIGLQRDKRADMKIVNKITSSISIKLLTIIFAGIIIFAVLLTVTSSIFIHSAFDKLYVEKLSGPGRTLLAQYKDAGQYSRYVDMLTSRETFIADSERYLANRELIEDCEKRGSPYPPEYNAAKEEMLAYTRQLSELKDAKYNAMFKSLLEIQMSSGIESMYIIADAGLENGYVFLFNTFFQGYTGVILHDDFGAVSPKSHYDGMDKLFSTGEAVYAIDKPERNRQGKLSHSFTPVTDGYGNIVAIIGVDINLESIGQQMDNFLMFSVIITVSVSVLIIVLMLLMLQRTILRPVKKLTDISAEIANGNVTVEIPEIILKRQDEMGFLGNSYETMRNALEKLISNNDALFNDINIGKIDTRGDSAQFSGLFARLIDNMNETLDEIGLYFDSIPASFAILESGYDIAYSNQSFKNTFAAYTGTEFLQGLLDDDDDDYGSLKQKFAGSIGQDEYECLRWLTTNGEERCYSFICSKVSHGDNKSGAVIVISDNTELVLAKDKALSASKAKSEFLSRISHELRTPLNTILSMAKLGLSDQELSVSVKRFERIVTSSTHLLNIINDVLEMSRMESGKTEIRYAPMDIYGLIDECVSMLTLRAQENKNELLPRIDTAIPPRVIGDEFRIKQILINLLSNSCKFTENGTIRIEADCLVQNGRDCTVQFTVADTGIGMTEAYLKKIFTPFEQEDSFLSRRYEGSGLGLSICSNLVSLMGGTINVTSEVGSGSCFVFSIQFQIASAEPAEAQKRENAADNDISLAGMRLLLVDDIEINRAIVIEILSGNNPEIEEATDGEEALHKYLRSPPGYYDCILMDVQMPKMDGYKATAAIRAAQRTDNDVPIIAMTANALKEDVDSALECGMNGHLAKPIDFELCVRTIKKHCTRR